MGERIQALPKGISKTSAWPYAEMPEKKLPRRKPTGWVMAISIEPELNGLVTFYPVGTQFEVPQEERTSERQIIHIDNGSWSGKKITTKPFYRVGDKAAAEKFCVTFCSLGYTKSPELLPHQGGDFWGLNWCSLTTATVAVASQIADNFFNDRYNEAWAVGKAFGDKIRDAENAAHAKSA